MSDRETCSITHRKWCAIHERAKARALQSRAPVRFMNEFEKHLERLRQLGGDGEFVVLDNQPPDDPVRAAAEVEALSAFRAMMHWGTDWGMCREPWPKRHGRAA